MAQKQKPQSKAGKNDSRHESQHSSIDDGVHRYGQITARILPLVALTVFAEYVFFSASPLGVAPQPTPMLHGFLALCIAALLLFHTNWREAAVIGGITGALVAFITAAIHALQDFSLVNLFRLFTDPLITGILDGVITGLCLLLLQLLWDLGKRLSKIYEHK